MFKVDKSDLVTQKHFLSEHLPNICLHTANGDLDFLNDKNMCSACWRCSLLTMDGGAFAVGGETNKNSTRLNDNLERQQPFRPRQGKILSLLGGQGEKVFALRTIK